MSIPTATMPKWKTQMNEGQIIPANVNSTGNNSGAPNQPKWKSQMQEGSSNQNNSPSLPGMMQFVGNQVTFTGKMEQRAVTSISTNMLTEATSGKGALSIKRHNEQMVVVDNQLEGMVAAVNKGFQAVQKIIDDFTSQVQNANKDIAELNATLRQRVKEQDPNLDMSDLEMNNRLMASAKLELEYFEASAKALLNNSERGLTIFNANTLNSINVIFKARQDEVALFSQKIELLHKQEKHDLDIALQQHEAKLKEQKQIFDELCLIVKMEEEKIQSAFDREITLSNTTHTHEIENRKLLLEEQVAAFSQELQAKQLENVHYIAQAELALKDKGLELDAEIGKMKINADKEAQMHAANIDGECRNVEALSNAASNAQKCTIF